MKSLLELFGARTETTAVNPDGPDFPPPLREKIRASLDRTLACVPTFAPASTEIRSRAMDALQPAFFGPREFLFEFEGPAGLYLLVAGAVELRSRLNPSQAVTVSGDCFFGEDALFGFSSLLSARALSACEVYLLTRERFNTLQAEFPLFGDLVAESKGRRINPEPEPATDRNDFMALKISGFELAPLPAGIVLQWNQAPAARGYRVLRKLGGGGWEVLTHTADTRFEDRPGSSSARYLVQAYSASALGESSAVLDFKHG